VPGRAKGPAAIERTRSRGCGQDPVRKGDEVHRVSRQCEVATRVSPGAQLAHHRESAAAASCRKQVRLTGRKLRQLVQIQIGYEPFRLKAFAENRFRESCDAAVYAREAELHNMVTARYSAN
jgi:hypothetical protein